MNKTSLLETALDEVRKREASTPQEKVEQMKKVFELEAKIEEVRLIRSRRKWLHATMALGYIAVVEVALIVSHTRIGLLYGIMVGGSFLALLIVSHWAALGKLRKRAEFLESLSDLPE